MAAVPPPPIYLLGEWLHTLGSGVSLGGALLCWAAIRHEAQHGGSARSALRVAEVYEWLFWAGAGTLVLGALATIGPTLATRPGLGTFTGTATVVYLIALVGLLGGSLVRTVGVIELGRGAVEDVPAAFDELRTSYVATAGVLLVIVALGEVVALG